MSDDYIGMFERVAILERLDDLFGGRVWRERVAPGYRLPRYDGLLLKPYLLISFRTPDPLRRERALVGGDLEQPRSMRFTTRVIGGHPGDVQSGNNAVVGRLTDWSPNEGNATDITSWASGSGDFRERRYLPPVAFERVEWETILVNAS